MTCVGSNNLHAVTRYIGGGGGVKDGIGKCHHVNFSTDVTMPERTEKQRHDAIGYEPAGANQGDVARPVGARRNPISSVRRDVPGWAGHSSS